MMEAVPGCAEDDEYKPCVYVPLSAEQAKSIQAGSEVSVTITGRAKAVTMRDKEKMEKWDEPGSLDLEIKSVKIDNSGEFDDMLDED